MLEPHEIYINFVVIAVDYQDLLCFHIFCSYVFEIAMTYKHDKISKRFPVKTTLVIVCFRQARPHRCKSLSTFLQCSNKNLNVARCA